MTLTEYASDVMYRRILNMSTFDANAPRLGDSALEAIKDLLHQRKHEPLTEAEIMELFEMGASEEFVMMAKYDDGELNSVRVSAEIALDDGNRIIGGFSGRLWDGELSRAAIHADETNTRRLREIFGVDYINGKMRFNADSSDPKLNCKVSSNENLVPR